MNYHSQLRSIQKNTKWSQEQLAVRLKVSFATLNSWLNNRSIPRQKAQHKIEKLYIEIVGSINAYTQADIVKMKIEIAGLPHVTARDIIANPELLQVLTLQFTYHTNTIEGSTMTVQDVKEVLFDDKVLQNRTAIEQLEARNHQAALHWLLQKMASEGNRFAIDEQLILGIHQRLMNGIASDAGAYRRHGVRIVGAHVALANWQSIPRKIAQLTASGIYNSNSVSDYAKAHAMFEQIHPFADGNGRTGRLLLLAQALQSSHYPPIVERERKAAYYRYLAEAQSRGNHIPLELFVLEEILYSYDLLGN